MVKVINLGDKKLIVGYNIQRYNKDCFEVLKSSDDLINMLNDFKEKYELSKNQYENLYILLNYENNIELAINNIKKYFDFRNDVDNVVINVLKNIILEKQEFMEDMLFDEYIKDKSKHKYLPYNYIKFIDELNSKRKKRKDVIMKLVDKYNIDKNHLVYLV